MSAAEVKVSIEDTEFTLTELAQFVERAREVTEIEWDGLVVVKKIVGNPDTFELSASSAYRSKS